MQSMEPYGREVEGSLRDFDQFLKTIVSYGREVDGSWRYFDQFFKAFVCRFRRHGCMKVTAWVEVTAWVSPIAREDRTDQGLSFLFFCRSHAVSSPHGVISTYGQSQSHGVSRTHGVSSSNCRKLQERIVQTKGYLFYFLSKSRREFTSRRDLNIRPKPKSRRESNSRREFDQLQEIAGEDSTDQGLSFLFFCRSHAVSSSHGVILIYGKSQSNDVKRGHSYIKVCFVSLIHGMRRNGKMSCVYSLQLNPFEWKN